MATIAEIPQRGNIKHCPSHGCLHLTYMSVTLHLPNEETFLQLAHAWAEIVKQLPSDIISALWSDTEDAPDEFVELAYRRTTIRLTISEAQELGRMMAAAADHLTALLLNTSDEEEEWPEGDVPVTIPPFPWFSPLPDRTENEIY